MYTNCLGYNYGVLGTQLKQKFALYLDSSQPIMFKILPIMLLSTAQNSPIMLNNMLIFFKYASKFCDFKCAHCFIRVNLHFGKHVTDCSIRMYYEVIVLLE